MKSLNQLASESLSVCDGCSNWRICKFSDDVKRAEIEYRKMQEGANWPECVETTLGCKYKQCVSNRYVTSGCMTLVDSTTTKAEYMPSDYTKYVNYDDDDIHDILDGYSKARYK